MVRSLRIASASIAFVASAVPAAGALVSRNFRPGGDGRSELPEDLEWREHGQPDLGPHYDVLRALLRGHGVELG